MGLFWIAMLLGIVEGLTEFLPVSSTGHLIVAGQALGLSGEKAKAFEIFIQLGAVLAVIWYYRRELAETAGGILTRRANRQFAEALLIAFIPAALVGLALHHWIEQHLFSPRAVAPALVLGGVAILAVELLHRVGAAARHRQVFGLPAEERPVELVGRLGVRRGEVNPGEGSRGVIRALAHRRRPYRTRPGAVRDRLAGCAKLPG